MLRMYFTVSLGIIVVLLLRPRRIVERLRIPGGLSLDAKRVLGASAIVSVLVPILGMPYVNTKAYMAYLATSTLFYVALVLLLARFDGLAFRLFRVVEGYSVYVLAAAFLAMTLAAGFFILGDTPHISDEVIYQFQAKALGGGKLYLTPPPVKEFFTFIHSIVDGEKWYGILNPGWPGILGVGYVAHTPWIVNPLLGSLTLVVFFAFYKEAGYSLLESRIAVLLLALSPFVLFMSATYMSHPANLFLFGLFCWACVKMHSSGSWGFAVTAGLALGLNILVRPGDSIAAAAPFLIYLTFQGIRNRRLVQNLGIVLTLASVFVGLTLLYNHQLTGGYLEFPMSKYFQDEGLGRFGLGFGADMGTKIHGPEWPGYYPSDAIRVSSYRFSELLLDFNGLPLLLVAACVFAVMRKDWRRRGWETVLMASALCVVVLYGLHFYHGIAFGPRHYYLALPALAVMIARPLGRWISEGDQSVGYFAKVSLVALLLHTVIFPYPRLIRRYGSQYRWASPAIREFVQEGQISNAVVFVASSNWGWKSAFPLNTYPLKESSVIFAQDRGDRNQLVIDEFPGRAYYHLRLVSHPERVEVRQIQSVKGEHGAGSKMAVSKTGT